MILRYRVTAIVTWAVIAIMLVLLAGIGESWFNGFVCFDYCPPKESLFTDLLYFLIGFLPGILCALIAWLLCVSIRLPDMRRRRLTLLATPIVIAALLVVLALVGYQAVPVDEGGRMIERGIDTYLLVWLASTSFLLIAWAGETAWLARSYLRPPIPPADAGAGQLSAGN